MTAAIFNMQMRKRTYFVVILRKNVGKWKKIKWVLFFCKIKKKFTYPFIINFPVLTSIRCSWSICGRQSCWCRVVIVFIVTVRWRYRTCRIICSIRNLKKDSAIISFKVFTSTDFWGFFFLKCVIWGHAMMVFFTSYNSWTTWCLRNSSWYSKCFYGQCFVNFWYIM